MKACYVDASVLRDYYENRRDNIRPLGEFAFNFFKKCKEKNAVVFYSDLTLKELQRYYSQERLKILLQTVSGFCELKKLQINEVQFNKARLLSAKFGVHLSDSLHVILAKENNAVLITRDNHFEKLSNFVEVASPEEII